MVEADLQAEKQTKSVSLQFGQDNDVTAILYKLDVRDRNPGETECAQGSAHGIIAACFWLQPECVTMNKHHRCQPVTNRRLIWHLRG
jgi:hypothetical protein